MFCLFVEIPVDIDITDVIWQSREQELSLIVEKPIGDRGTWLAGNKPTRHYWFDRLSLRQATEARKAIVANGWRATIREH